MQLHLKRTRETRREGLLRRPKDYWRLYARIELTPDEEALVGAMKLGDTIIFSTPSVIDPDELWDWTLDTVLSEMEPVTESLEELIHWEDTIKHSCALLKEALDRGFDFEEGEEVIRF